MYEQVSTRQIRDWILSSIKSGAIAPGDKLPSESELCRHFGASRSAVRQAIAALTSERWLRTQKGVGSFCLVKDRPLTTDIGLICFFSSSYIFPRIARGCDQVAHRRGFHILLNQSEYDLGREREILEKLRKRGVDGIVIEPVFDGDGPSNADLLEGLEAAGVPVVLLDNDFPGRNFTRVALDDHAGGRLVASHLLEKGHREIAVLYDRGYLPKRRRMEGAVERLAEAGARPGAQRLIGYDGPVSSGRALRGARGLLRRGGAAPPTAFICTSDEEAVELYRAAENRGLQIPRDLSVISFDNSSLADLPGVSLTSVDHPGQYMGELAVQLLLDRLLNPAAACRTTSLIAPRLVQRRSVAEIQRSR